MDSTRQDAYIQLRERAQECTNDHKLCPKIEPRKLPYRVIDVEPGATKLVLTHGQHGYYTALSYIWGMPTQPVMAEMKTVDALMKLIDVDALPRTLKDAIIVTRDLGIKYLWIDSLCIIQDSRADKDQQIGQIQHIFGNAYLTICAAKARSCTHGFLDVDIEHLQAIGFQEFSLPYLCPNGIPGEIVLQPLKAYGYTAEEQPISHRAWTLEERLLSPRVAIYAYGMIIWQCRAGLFTVGGERGSMYDNEENMSGVGSLHLDEAFFESSSIDNSVPTQKIEALQIMWAQILEDYTHRELSRPRDRLRAISGIAATFKSVFPESHYKAGIWFHNLADCASLASQLLWVNNDYIWGRAVRLGDPDAPSWSWASVMSKANVLHFDKTQEMKAAMEFVRCDTTLVSEANAFGRVEGGRLCLRAPRRICTLEERAERPKFDFCPIAPTSNFQSTFPHLKFRPSVDHLDAVGETVNIWFIQLFESAGLALAPAKDDNSFRRIGMFWFGDNGGITKSGIKKAQEFFKKSIIYEMIII